MSFRFSVTDQSSLARGQPKEEPGVGSDLLVLIQLKGHKQSERQLETPPREGGARCLRLFLQKWKCKNAKF